MISDEDLFKREAEIEKLFLPEQQSALETRPNPQRIEKIINKALYETVLKDTTSFVFNSFGSVIVSLTGAVFGARNTNEIGVNREIPYHNTPYSESDETLEN